MAEATVENSRFFCHRCSAETTPTAEFICPTCQSGFIEAIEEDQEGRAQSPFRSNPEPPDLMEVLSHIMGGPPVGGGRTLGRVHVLPRNRRIDEDELDDDEDDIDAEVHNPNFRDDEPLFSIRPSGPAGNTRQRSREYMRAVPMHIHNGGPGIHIHHGPAAFGFDTLLQQLFGGLGGGGGQRSPFGHIFGLHGNEGDYAWGPQGLDAIITQLLNQLEGSGPPPAEKQDIEKLPEVKITQDQVDRVVQCSVCMEDFALDETVRRLPCDHHFHTDCIVPWLEMHGTCPVCRKTLKGEDTSTTESLDISEEQAAQAAQAVRQDSAQSTNSAAAPSSTSNTSSSNSASNARQRRSTRNSNQSDMDFGLD